MTKAELLRRYRWLLLVLPTGTVAGFRLLNAFRDVKLFTVGPFIASIGSLLRNSALSAESAWLAVTAACSILTACDVCGDKRDVDNAVINAVLVFAVFGMHFVVIAALFGSSPFK